MTKGFRLPLRVLLFTDCPDVYGAERWNGQLLSGLRLRGHTVSIAQPMATNELTKQLALAGISQHWLTPVTMDDPWRTFAADSAHSLDHSEARAVVAATMPDVIVCSDGEPGSNLAAKEVAALAGVPYVIVSHLGYDIDAKERAFAAPMHHRIARAHQAAAAIVGVSNSNLQSLNQAFELAESVEADACKSIVIPNARPEHFFAQVNSDQRLRTRTEFGFDDETVVFCTLARPHPNKRYSIQIDAIRQLQSHPIVSKARFVWAGDGPGLGRLRMLVRAMGLDSVVTICGHVTDSRLLIDAADAFVLPSAREGMPLAILEAMAGGLAVIASDVGGVAEALGGTGVLLPDPNVDRQMTVDALQKALIDLTTDSNTRHAYGDAARRRAGAHFREVTMIDRYETLLTAVVQGRPTTVGDPMNSARATV